MYGKQTLKQLAEKYEHSHIWVRRQLDLMPTPKPTITPQETVVVSDTTFWGRHYGVTVFRAPLLSANVWWDEVRSERVATYHYGRKILEGKGWKFTAAVVDGRRGLINVFNDIPVQMCQFHQIKIVTRYLSRRPRSDAGKELRILALTLTKTNEKTFTGEMNEWHEKWSGYIREKTYDTFPTGKKKWHYTHGKVRSAYRSLKNNLPHLFTYLKYPELNIPNTTNSLDGSFSALKKKLAVHHGLRKDRRYKVISQILKDSRPRAS